MAAVTEDEALRIDIMERALLRIAAWADAYPVTAFPKVTEDYAKRAQEVLIANGMTLDRVSADAMRHVVTQVSNIAKDALYAAR